MDNATTSPDLTLRLNGHEAQEEYVIEVNNTNHLLFIIPGTTDPINLKENRSNDASFKYWDKPFYDGLKAFAKRFPLRKNGVYDFRWTGDNQIDARQQGARDLLALVKRVTFNERTGKGKRVNIHFICHSHGGNVINDFTNYAAKDPEFPENFKVRSIVYLSTPFFREQAQINTDLLHPHCDIINVFNKYDLTQRFVANFSMHQMPSLLERLENDKELDKAVKAIKKAPYVDMATMLVGNSISRENSIVGKATSKALWFQIHEIFKNINKIINQINKNIIDTNTEYPKFITNDILSDLSGGILASIMDNLSGPINNLSDNIQNDTPFSLENLTKAVGPGITDFVENLNDFLKFYPKDEFSPDGLRSKLSDVIGNILMNQMQAFDDTIHKPEPQLNGLFKVKHIDVTKHDAYDKLPESKNYDAFLARLEELEDDYRMSNEYGPDGANVRAEIVFTLAAQEDYGIFLLLDTILKWMNEITKSQIQSLIQQTRKTISIYSRELKKRDNKIIHHAPTETINVSRFVPYEKEIEEGVRSIKHTLARHISTPFSEAKGGIPYLAVESHSTSRRSFLPELKNRWASSMPDKKYAPLYSIKKK